MCCSLDDFLVLWLNIILEVSVFKILGYFDVTLDIRTSWKTLGYILYLFDHRQAENEILVLEVTLV